MSEPRKPVLVASISTRALERAVKRLPLARYPVRLAVIDEELRKRAVEMRERRRAA
jgi:hypothetical protein